MQANVKEINTGEVLPKETGIVAYDPFYAQLEELKKNNAVTVFEYDTPAGNKAARSYVFTLRKTKTAVDNVRKELGEESRQYVLKVNAEAKNIISNIEEMITVHQTQIDAVEQRETDRKAAIMQRIKDMTHNAESGISAQSSEFLKHLLAIVTSIEVDTSFAEFMHIAVGVKANSIEYLNAMIGFAEKREADARELERLRVEAAERSRLEREESIRKEAADAANAKAERERLDAEAKAAKALQDEKDAAAKREADAKAESERKAKEAAEAVAKAERDAAEAEQRAREKLAEEERAKSQAELARSLDVENKKTINNAILNALLEKVNTADEAIVKLIIQAIAKGEIPHIKITY